MIRSLKENLSTIDKAIHIFDEHYNLSSVKAKSTYRNRYFNTGEAKVMILDILRELNKPTKTDEICKMIASKKSLSFEASEDNKSFNKAVTNVLNRIEKDNLIERVGKDGLMVIWQIAKVQAPRRSAIRLLPCQ